jgi:hypothetical protein
MKAKLRVLVTVLGFFCLAVPALAHHAFDSEYDPKKKVTLTGVVNKVAWTNPHMRVYVDVTDEKGAVTTWNLELSSPNNARREGWSKDDLKPGEKVTFEANPGRLVESRAALRLITRVGETKPIFRGTNPEAQN